LTFPEEKCGEAGIPKWVREIQTVAIWVEVKLLHHLSINNRRNHTIILQIYGPKTFYNKKAGSSHKGRMP
jgi:hypothetical protein